MFENPTVAAVVGALAGALFTVVATAFVRRLMRKVKRVECVITEVSSLLASSDRIANELEVTFSGTVAKSVYLVSMEVVNTGTDPIKRQPIRIRLADGARIVDYTCQTEPLVGFGEIKELTLAQNELDLEVELLNPKDKLTVELVSLDNPNEMVEVYLKNEGVESRIYSRGALRNAVLNLAYRESIWPLVFMASMPIGGALARVALLEKILNENVRSKTTR